LTSIAIVASYIEIEINLLKIKEKIIKSVLYKNRKSSIVLIMKSNIT